MRFSSLLTFVVGLSVAGGSALLARDFLENQYGQANSAQGPEMVNVVVASSDIAFGQEIEARHLKTIAWPKSAVPAGTFDTFADLVAKPDQPKRRARRAIGMGELVLGRKVSGYGEKVTIVQTLAPNHRAIAINVNAETAVGGFVTPGDNVDILLTQGRNENLKTITILQGVRVIGVDQDADEQTDTPEVARTVTVEVTPEEGQRLALARRAGTLSLTLRTLNETDEVPLKAIRLSDILNSQPEAKVEEAVAKRTIVVRRGTTVSMTPIN